VQLELFFVRHGQGEHNLDVPDRLNIAHPHLTDKGKAQVDHLHTIFKFGEQDLFIVSPTVRTIETVQILTRDLLNPVIFISPVVGPRMFPQNSEWNTSKCDETLIYESIESEYPGMVMMNKGDKYLWFEGVNSIDERLFQDHAHPLIEWIKKQPFNRVFIITHDGTINCYRQLLGEHGLTRSDFLGEAGYHRLR
jgi:broad specificity phosphatase PhoE